MSVEREHHEVKGEPLPVEAHIQGTPINGIRDRLRTTVVQDDKGNCTVIEHDMLNGTNKPIAKFPAEKRRVITDGDETYLDVAGVRAVIFARTLEVTVNQNQIPHY